MHLKKSGVVVQLVRIPACHAGGRGFESRPYRRGERRMSNRKSFRFLYSFFFCILSYTFTKKISSLFGLLNFLIYLCILICTNCALMRVKIHHEGTNIIIVLLIILLAINIPLWLYVDCLALNITISAISAILWLLVVNFFRSPRRSFTGNRENVVVASADGKVVALERTFEDEYLHREVIQVSVFMSIFNVHANWFPVDGEVIYSKHHSGRFMRYRDRTHISCIGGRILYH